MACRIIKEEKWEIDRFIQLNSKVQKKGNQFKSKGSKCHLIWRPGISNEPISFKIQRDK